jgi:hypothetical protein
MAACLLLVCVGFVLGCGGSMGSGTLPRTYDAPRATSLINLDGDPSDPAWSGALWTTDFVDIRSQAESEESSNPGEILVPAFRTRAKILWDDEYLYIAAEVEEPHLWATLLERDAIIYQDDDFEVFLDPDGDRLAYFELEINALGTEFDLFLDKPYKDGGKAEIGWDMLGLRTGVSLVGSLNDPTDEDQGWSVEIGIPWKALVPPGNLVSSKVSRLPEEARSAQSPSPPLGSAEAPGPQLRHGSPPQTGDTWRINFSRVDWPLSVVNGRYQKAAESTRDNPHPEANWVWSPQGTINMHIPEMWGVVRFVEGGK